MILPRFAKSPSCLLFISAPLSWFADDLPNHLNSYIDNIDTGLYNPRTRVETSGNSMSVLFAVCLVSCAVCFGIHATQGFWKTLCAKPSHTGGTPEHEEPAQESRRRKAHTRLTESHKTRRPTRQNMSQPMHATTSEEMNFKQWHSRTKHRLREQLATTGWLQR